MFNVNISAGEFAVVTVTVPHVIYNSAISYYKSKLRAREKQSSRNGTLLSSAYGFTINVVASNLSGCRARISIRGDAARLTSTLCSGGRLKRVGSSVTGTDPYGVTWTVTSQ